ncbi:MAG: HAD family phosphatase [Chloroflexales bacterium]|nr:HAD family phosphatase [Chloroflexales bacterium]
MATIKTIFFDLGGVCLSNGWDREQRRVVTERYAFDYDTFDRRHRQVVDALERGQMTLSEYLRWTIFYEPRSFTSDELTQTILAISAPFPDTLALVRQLRGTGRYLLATLNNESRELNEHRIERFALRELFTAFFSSCYFGLLKPQPEIYRRALQITQCPPDECIYIDDRPMNVEVASILGMRAIQFTSAAQLAADLREAGVSW